MRSLVSSLQTISIQHPVWEFWNYYKTVGKSCKRSNPLSSAVKPCFSLGISHFLRVPRDFCSLHATRCVSPAALHFASRPQNRVVFRVALWRQNIGLLHTSESRASRRQQRQWYSRDASRGSSPCPLCLCVSNSCALVCGAFLKHRDAESTEGRSFR
jgi:hypothetical protein